MITGLGSFTYIMLLFFVEGLEFFVFVDFGEDALVIEYFERAYARVASVFKNEQVCLIEHFLHANGLVVSWRLANFTPFTLVILDFFGVMDAQLSNCLLVLRRLVHFRCHIRHAIFLKFMARRGLEQGCLSRGWILLPYTKKLGFLLRQ